MTFSPIPPGREQRFARLYFDVYPYARKAVIALQVHTRQKSKKVVHSIKDAFDHTYFALLPETSDEEVHWHFCQAEDHLRRAAVEPVEYIAENTLHKLTGLLDLRASRIGRVFGFTPVPPPEARQKIRDGRAALVRCRELKSQVESVKEAYEAAVTADALFTAAYDDLGPTAVYRRIENFWCSLIAGVVLLSIGGIAGFIIARVSHWWGGP